MLNKLLTLVLCLAINSCNTLKGDLVYRDLDSTLVHYEDFNLYTFVITHNKGSHRVRGQAFIAENKIYTARHVVEDIIIGEQDCISLGCSDVQGFSICREEHVYLDTLFFRSSRGIIYMTIFDMSDIKYIVICNDSIKFGDSGSPVFCNHSKVVGVVSGFRPNNYIVPEAGGVEGAIHKIIGI